MVHRPLMIVDEVHGGVKGLTRLKQEPPRPAAIIAFTATPRDRNNILFSVTAGALKDEELIKLPIRVKAHESWQQAVTGAVATRNRPEETAKRKGGHLRPVALYQAQAKNGTPTVAEVRDFLHKVKPIPLEQIKVATGEQRERDGLGLRDPAEPTRHVITVLTLKEGRDCPSAHVLRATQRLTAAGAVEPLWGRMLRMPHAKRLRDHALDSAHAHVSQPSFAEAAAQLRDKLIDMGFTDEEVRESLRPRSGEPAANGDLFDPDPVDPKPVLTYANPDTPQPCQMLEAHVPHGGRTAFRKAAEARRAKVEAKTSPADEGAPIAAPVLVVRFQGNLSRADTDLINERVV